MLLRPKSLGLQPSFVQFLNPPVPNLLSKYPYNFSGLHCLFPSSVTGFTIRKFLQFITSPSFFIEVMSSHHPSVSKKLPRSFNLTTFSLLQIFIVTSVPVDGLEPQRCRYNKHWPSLPIVVSSYIESFPKVILYL